jgi:hypothetical protein
MTSTNRSTTLVRLANEYSNSPEGGKALCPNPGWSGATRWKRSASAGIRLRNIRDDVGRPCSSSSVGLAGSLASR